MTPRSIEAAIGEVRGLGELCLRAADAAADDKAEAALFGALAMRLIACSEELQAAVTMRDGDDVLVDPS